ncbi:MAG: type 4a pilus biogenesis protein PilO [bacterium]|nr:type 4a pilus biogenesis protein PilO [bacterium]
MNMSDPVVQRRAFIILIGLLVGYLYFGSTFFPFCHRVRKAEIARLDTENKELERKLVIARSKAGRLEVVEARMASLEQDWRRIEQLLPSTEAMPEFMKDMTRLATKANIEIDLMQPDAPVAGDGFRARSIQMRARGGYHEIGRFLSHIANARRLIKTEALTMGGLTNTASRKNVEGGEKTGTVEVSFKATLFMLEAGNAGN